MRKGKQILRKHSPTDSLHGKKIAALVLLYLSVSALHPELGLQFVSPVSGLTIGQVGGVGVGPGGELHIFHRGGNIWSSL